MAAVTQSQVNGKNGNITKIGLQNDADDWVIKLDAFILAFTDPLDDTSGYGDAGFRTYDDTIKSGQFQIAGWLQTSTKGKFDPNKLGEAIASAVFTCDTGVTYTGTIKVESHQINHRYNHNVPVRMSGKFTGAITAAPVA